MCCKNRLCTLYREIPGQTMDTSFRCVDRQYLCNQEQGVCTRYMLTDCPSLFTTTIGFYCPMFIERITSREQSTEKYSSNKKGFHVLTHFVSLKHWNKLTWLGVSSYRWQVYLKLQQRHQNENQELGQSDVQVVKKQFMFMIIFALSSQFIW